MILVVIIFSLIYVILLALILVAYYRDNTELERRVLELEKKNDDCINALNKIIKRSNFLEWVHIPDTDFLLRLLNKYENKENENNTQKECDCNMPCGRKKGRGGRRK